MQLNGGETKKSANCVPRKSAKKRWKKKLHPHHLLLHFVVLPLSSPVAFFNQKISFSDTTVGLNKVPPKKNYT